MVRLYTEMDDPSEDGEVAHDARLVRRAREGDYRAFEELVRRHERAAQQLAAFVCGSTMEALDVTQEAYLTAFTTLATLHEAEAFRPWLMRITVNTARNRMRAASRRARRERRVAAFATAPQLLPDERAVAAEDERALWRALGGLGERERLVVALRYAAGLSEAETAATLGIPVGTVKSRTARAMKALRARLGESDD